MNKQIKYGALISYIALFINIVIGLVYSPWVIRSIGKADYGLYTLALSIISLFVFDFGLGSAVTRFIAKYNAEGRQDKVNNFIGMTVKLYLLADIFIFVLLSAVFLLIPVLYKGLTPEEIEKFKIVFVISSSFSIVSFPFIPANGILSAYEKFVPLKLCDLAHKLIIVILMSTCLLLGLGLYALVIVNAVAGILTIILKLISINKYINIKINWNFWDKKEIKAVLGFSVWVMIMAICQRCVLNICPSILGMLSNTSAIAVFGVAVTIEGLIYSFANALNGLFLPKVSKMVANNDNNAIQDLMTRVGRIQIFIISLLIIGFICVGQSFIEAWLGPEYTEVFWCVVLLIAPSFIYLPEEVANTTCVAKNKVKYQAYISILKGITNIVIAFPLVKLWGVYGMALSVFISYSVSILFSNILYRKQLNIDIKLFFAKSFLKFAPSLFLVFILTYTATSFIAFSGWLGVIMKGSVVVCIYFPIMYLCGLNKSEKKLFISFIRR